MRRNCLQVSPDIDEAMVEHERRGRTAVLVAVDGKVVQFKCKAHICSFFLFFFSFLTV